MSSYTISYADFISMLLTAISLLMTLLAFFLGVLGLIGWSAISRGVNERVEKFLEEGFKEGNSLHQLINSKATSAMYAGVETIKASIEDEVENDQ